MKKFEWTDELVLEFAGRYGVVDMKTFKENRSRCNSEFTTFMTLDNVRIYEGDIYYIVYPDKDWSIGSTVASKYSGKPPDDAILFSSLEVAMDYISFNKKQFSFRDIKCAFFDIDFPQKNHFSFEEIYCRIIKKLPKNDTTR